MDKIFKIGILVLSRRGHIFDIRLLSCQGHLLKLPRSNLIY